MGAIGEWISVAPIRRIAKVAPAFVAGAGIRRDQCECTTLLPAAQDRESRAPLNIDFGDADLLYLRQPGRIVPKRLKKFIERRSGAFDLNGDAGRGIEDIPTQPER